MTLFSVILCYLREKKLSNFFQILLMAFGTALITAIILVNHQVKDKLYTNHAGIDAVIGAKGSPLQLVLSSLYHMDIPTGNITLKDAKYIEKHPMVKKSIPVSLGDNFQGYRIIGTNASYLDHYNAEFAQGGLWNASMQVVIGHIIAQEKA